MAGDVIAHTCRHCGQEAWDRYEGNEEGEREYDTGYRTSGNPVMILLSVLLGRA